MTTALLLVAGYALVGAIFMAYTERDRSPRY